MPLNSMPNWSLPNWGPGYGGDFSHLGTFFADHTFNPSTGQWVNNQTGQPASIPTAANPYNPGGTTSPPTSNPGDDVGSPPQNPVPNPETPPPVNPKTGFRLQGGVAEVPEPTPEPVDEPVSVVPPTNEPVAGGPRNGGGLGWNSPNNALNNPNPPQYNYGGGYPGLDFSMMDFSGIQMFADGGQVKGGGMKIKKQTFKDRYGNTTTTEYFDDSPPVDQTALMKEAMKHGMPMMEVPQMPQQIPHPGGPRGTDTVPAWLTPGEFVVNKEAVDMYGPAIKEMNEHGRDVQELKEGGTALDNKISKVYNEGHTAPGQAYTIAKSMGYADGGEVVDTLLAGGITPERLNELGYPTIPGPTPIQGDIPYGQEFDLPLPVPMDELEVPPTPSEELAEGSGFSLMDVLTTPAGVAPELPENIGNRTDSNNPITRAGHFVSDVIGNTIDTIRGSSAAAGFETAERDVERLTTLRNQQIAEGAPTSVIEQTTMQLQEATNRRDLLEGKEGEAETRIADREVAADTREAERRQANLNDALEKGIITQEEYDQQMNVPPTGEPPKPTEATPVSETKAIADAEAERLNEERRATAERMKAVADQAAVVEAGRERAEKDPGLFQSIVRDLKEGILQGLDDVSIGELAFQYLGSRVLGYSHGDALRYIGEAEASRVEREAELAQKMQERQIDFEYQTALKRYDKQLENAALSDVDRALIAAGVSDTGEMTEYVKTGNVPGMSSVRTWVGAGGMPVYFDPNTESFQPFNTQGYEAYNQSDHGAKGVHTQVKQTLKDASIGGSISVQTYRDDGTRVTENVEPADAIAALAGIESVYTTAQLRTPAGRNHALQIYQAGSAWQARTGNKIKNWPGFIAAFNSGIYGTDSNPHIIELTTQDNGKDPINQKHYEGLDSLLDEAKNKSGLRTSGAFIQVALDAYNNPTPEIQTIIDNIKVPPGSSKKLEFLKAYASVAIAE